MSSDVQESAGYQNLITEMSDYQHIAKLSKPEQTPDFPFELKVHLRSAGHCNLLAETIGKALSSKRV